jgi:hypothetical protein
LGNSWSFDNLGASTSRQTWATRGSTTRAPPKIPIKTIIIIIIIDFWDDDDTSNARPQA